MKKLSKDQIETRDKLASQLRSRKEDLDIATEAYNTSVQTARELLDAARNDYNESVAETKTWLEEIVAAIDEYVSERSEKWQESDKAAEYESWKDQFESAEISEVELDDFEPIEWDLEDGAEILEGLPEQVEN